MTQAYCPHCGESTTSSADHARCRTDLEPPRYCAQCRRRMVVQVLPNGWRARCVEHGQTGSSTTPR